MVLKSTLCSGREGHNNYRRDLVIWLVHLIYTVRLAKVALCYNYVILNYCIRFAVLPCVRLCLNSCWSSVMRSASQHRRPTSIGTSELYRIIGSYANQSADIADPVEPIERPSSLSGNLVTERFI